MESYDRGTTKYYAQAFQLGEEKAYDYFFRLYFRLLCFFARSILKHYYEPEDIVQDCFIKLWKCRTTIKHPEAIKTYLYRTVRNACIDQLRRKENKLTIVPLTDDLVDEDEYLIHEDNVIKAEFLQEIYTLMNDLPERVRQVFQLYYLHGKDEVEIGQLLHTSPYTVRNQRARAIALLRQKITIS